MTRWARTVAEPDLVTFWLGAAYGRRACGLPATLVSRAHGGDLFPTQHGWHSIPVPAGGRERRWISPACRRTKHWRLRSRNHIETRDASAEGLPIWANKRPPPTAHPVHTCVSSGRPPAESRPDAKRVVQRLSQTVERVEWTLAGPVRVPRIWSTRWPSPLQSGCAEPTYH